MESLITHSSYLFLKDLAAFIFTVAGLVIAGMGLATWKKQIKGEKKFNTAYDLHCAILKLRNAIKYVRNPAIFPSENYKALAYSKEKYPNRSTEEIEKDSHAYVYEMRWEEIQKASVEMESHLLAAEVLWGPEILSLIKPLNVKITELNIALKQKFQPELRTMDAKELHSVIYDSSDWSKDNHDAFSKEVHNAISCVETYLKSKDLLDTD